MSSEWQELSGTGTVQHIDPGALVSGNFKAAAGPPPVRDAVIAAYVDQ